MGGFSRHQFLYAHVAATASAALWLTAVLHGTNAIAIAALVVISLSTAYVAALERRTREAVSLAAIPRAVFALDLTAAALNLTATAPNDRSVAFVVVVLVGAIGVPRFGLAVLGPVLMTYAAGRAGQELYRIAIGTPTPPSSLAAEVAVFAGACVVFLGAVNAYRAERDRATAALRRAASLELVAHDLAASSSSTRMRARSTPRSSRCRSGTVRAATPSGRGRRTW